MVWRVEGSQHDSQSVADRDPKPRGLASRSVGMVIGLFGLAFAVYAAYLARGEVSLDDVEPALFGISVIVGAGAMLGIGLNWIRIIRLLGWPARYGRDMRWYFVGQLGKYIPGGLWAVLGRSELSARDGVPRTIAYPSVAMSLITTYAAAATTGAVFLAVAAAETPTKVAWMAGSVGVLAVSVLGLSEYVIGPINRTLNRLGITTSLPSARPLSTLQAILLTMPSWVLIGAATGLTARAIGVSAELPQVIAATSYSWLAGFLVIPLPGGLGVREAAFIALWQGSGSEAAAIAIAARLTFVLADIAGALVSTIVSRVLPDAQSTSESR